MKKTKVAVAGVPGIDPTLPQIEIKLGGETYFMCFTFGAMAIAKARLRVAGIECNLLQSLDLRNLDADQIVPLLYAALIMHQPDITPLEVAGLVTIPNLGNIFDGILKAYSASLADPSDEDKQEKANPKQPE
ncbi:hypothetical protein [Edaphobacter modestus]|uniref:Uncharacterized protein n=1 Tax=Edaphobacter modestus TaxID=388466 RepID=A0A4Q7YR66_9BACT|nr:hypothetical protein [Edaphobacter modestus]RZU39329.1 hypothetical protein BDD14_0698 [Edaphobacter modestus]